MRILLRLPIFKCNCRLVRTLHVYSQTTQFETSKMSNLKMTHLNDINSDIFNLYRKLIDNEEVNFLNDIFVKKGFEIRMAGGGVRDLLCKIVPHDIDFATDAEPDQMISMMRNFPNIRLITTLSGQKHGTVTVRINNKSQFEITTLRIDKSTDGRHAEVEFINDWKLDASRRDLTINSMFLDLNGVLYDYFNGESDLKNGIIRFVGDPEKRIQEDYLRIFRYFRFHTRFGLAGNHDPATLETIKRNLNGLETISGERIWTEMKRILSNINCLNSIETMFQTLKSGKYLGFISDPVDMKEFHAAHRRLSQLNETDQKLWKPQTLFSALIANVDELVSVISRLKLSNIERNTINYILANRETGYDRQTLRRQLALAPKPNQEGQRQFIVQFLCYSGAQSELINELHRWEIPKFPFNGNMVANRIQNRKQIGQLLDHLKSIWADRDFCMNELQMKEEVDRFIK